jgi:hypothetical protein
MKVTILEYPNQVTESKKKKLFGTTGVQQGTG